MSILAVNKAFRCSAIGYPLAGQSDNKDLSVRSMSWYAAKFGFSFWLEKLKNNKWTKVAKYNKHGKKVKVTI